MKGFDLSTDYDLLYKIIKEGYRIPAWILYSEKYEDPIFDLVEVKMSKYDNNIHQIGTRGIGYENFEFNIEGFKKNCEFIQLKFIVPNKFL